MTGLGVTLIILGICVAVVGHLIFTFVALSEHWLWGLGCLLLAFPVSIFFLLGHWSKARKSFSVSLIGLTIIGAGIYVLPAA